MPALAYTLKMPTMENITNNIQEKSNKFFSKDNLLYDYSSSTSLLPEKIPLGLCSSFLSEDTIPDSSPYSSMELIPRIPGMSENHTDNLTSSRHARECRPLKTMSTSQVFPNPSSAPTLVSPIHHNSRLKLSDQSFSNILENFPSISGWVVHHYEL